MAAAVLTAPGAVSASESPLALGALLVYLFAMLVKIGLRSIRTRLMRRPVPLEPAASLRVAMCVTTVPSREPLAIVEATVRAMLAVRYPHDSYVLAEEDDPAQREL